MKKMLWAVLVVAVALPSLFAKQTNLEKQVSLAMLQQQQQQSSDNIAKMLTKVDSFRSLVKNMTYREPSKLMQSAVEIADAFFGAFSGTPGIPSKVEDFQPTEDVARIKGYVLVIDAPVQAGWDKQQWVTLSEEINDFLDRGAWQWNAGVKEVDTLRVFRDVLKKYASTDNEPSAPAGHPHGVQEVTPDYNGMLIKHP